MNQVESDRQIVKKSSNGLVQARGEPLVTTVREYGQQVIGVSFELHD